MHDDAAPSLAVAASAAAWWATARRPARVHTDTRSLQPGDLFVALRASTSTPTIFWLQAKARAPSRPGAARAAGAPGLPGLEVADTKLALGAAGRRLARRSSACR